MSEQQDRIDEPIALVGIGCVFPFASGAQAFWRHLCTGQVRPVAFPLHRFMRTEVAVRTHLASWRGVFFESFEPDFKRFRIPPVCRKSVSRTMMMMLQAAAQCLDDADFGKVPASRRDEVDVYCGTCFGYDNTLNNALKVEGVQLLQEMFEQHPEGIGPWVDPSCERLRAHFGSCSHDRVGEMAGSIGARIAGHFGFRGRVQTLESADATGFSLIEAAAMSLASGQAETVLVTSGQGIDSLLMPLALEKKGFAAKTSGHPLACGTPDGVLLGEGATALLLQRLPDAHRDGARIYSVIRGLAARKHSTASGFKYTGDTESKAGAIGDACHRAGIDPAAMEFVECVLPGQGRETRATLETLAAVRGPEQASPLYLGSGIAGCGHGFANAALTAVASASLALHHELIPPLPGIREELPSRSFACAERPVSWPEGERSRIAGVTGTAVTGIDWHVVLSAPDPTDATSGVEIVATPERGAPGSSRPGIAVVGVAGSYGPCAGTRELWEGLLSGLDAVQPVPESILPRHTGYGAGTNKALSSYAQMGADLKQREFDLSPYRIFPRRAAAIDVAQKLALGVAAEALDDYRPADEQDRLGRVKVIVATSLSLGRERRLACGLHFAELQDLLAQTLPPQRLEAWAEKYRIGPDAIDHFSLDGYLASGIATLISDCLGLDAVTGAVEAACASSLAAVSNAVLSLRQHRCDLALAGGVELPVNLRELILCSAQMMFSQDKIAPFAVDADGFSPGDGAGMFVLKRLEDAARDGDKVYATITGVGSSCDAGSMTAPNPEGQALAIRRAVDQAGYSPGQVQYVEAHGTGTALGDVAEIDALRSIYACGQRKRPLMIGSVKSNLGHTFAAAGSAGLLKTLLAMKEGRIPPTLVRRAINPELPLKEIPAEVVTELRQWPAEDGRRTAAVSSFGTGGINFHLLLEAQDNQ